MAEATEKNKLAAQTLLKESDRGCTILAAGLLTDALEDLLRSFCRQKPEDVRAAIEPLFVGYAPLSTLSARIQIAFALGILPRDVRNKIEIVRRLRNDFAHDWGPIDFRDARCADRLALLIGSPTREGAASSGEDDEASRPSIGPTPTKEQFVARLAFALSVMEIVGRLSYLADLARKGHDIRWLVWKREEEEGGESSKASGGTVN